MSLLDLQSVSFAYGGSDSRSTVKILEGVSLKLSDRESLGLIGPSGSGKSTLLRMMAGLLRPQGGQIYFEGQNLYDLSPKQRRSLAPKMGMTFQRGGLFDSLTCYENLELALTEHSQLKQKERTEVIHGALEQVGLEGTASLFVHELSGGMQKRLGIARALVLKPSVVFYDEPTAGLDPITSRSILELIARLKEERKMTVVLVMSEVSRLYSLVDRLAFLYQGKFTALGPTSEVRRSEIPVIRQFLKGRLEGPLTKGDALA